MSSVAAPRVGVDRRELLQRFGRRPETPSLVFLVVLLVVFAAAVPGFVDASNIESTISQITVIGIVALAVNQVILAGDIDVSTGSALAVSAFVAGRVAEHVDSLVVPLLAAVGVAVLIGAVNGVLVTRLRLPAIIATLGLLYLLRGVLLAEGGDTVVNPPDAARALGDSSIAGIDVSILLLVAVFLGIEFLRRHTVWGRDVLAVGGNVRAARVAALNVPWIRMRTFLLVGACVGLAAMVYIGQIGQIQATAGTGFELQPIAAVVVGGTSIAGGRGSNLAPLIGAILIGVILNALTLLGVSGTYTDLVMGALILLAILTDVVRRRTLGARA